MAQFFACRTLLQNLLLGGKDKLAGTALNKDNDTFAVLYAPTLATAFALPVISTSSFVV